VSADGIQWGNVSPIHGWLTMRPTGFDSMLIVRTNSLAREAAGMYLAMRVLLGCIWRCVWSMMQYHPEPPIAVAVTVQEGGPPPVLLSDGNYLFVYNSARHGYPSIRPGWDVQVHSLRAFAFILSYRMYCVQYNFGYVILNGSDPSQIIDRSPPEWPLFSPILPWEIGTTICATVSGVVTSLSLQGIRQSISHPIVYLLRAWYPLPVSMDLRPHHLVFKYLKPNPTL
jgi:hypothetical protein